MSSLSLLLNQASFVTFFLKKENYLFWAVLGLHCFAWAFSSCDMQGLTLESQYMGFSRVFPCIAEVLGAWASAAVAWGLNRCGTWA